MTIPRPDPGDYAAFFDGYVARVPDCDVLEVLEAQGRRTAALVRGAGEARGDFAYAEGKWSVKRLLLHVAVGHAGDVAVEERCVVAWIGPGDRHSVLAGSWW